MIGFLVTVAVVVGTTVWVGADAAALQRKGAAIQPGAWVCGCLLLWIVFLPAYIVKRSRILTRRADQAETVGFDPRSWPAPTVPAVWDPALPSRPPTAPPLADELATLVEMRDSGSITPGEFEARKARLLR